jgi:hypothetical protein
MKGETHGTFLPIPMSFHAKSKCLSNWDYYQKGSATKQIIPFNNKISLDSNIKLESQHKQQLNELIEYGIDIVSQTKFVTYNQIPGN